ncbi:hypothetical protein ACHAPJ_005905 [Fusarium lateritium]
MSSYHDHENNHRPSGFLSSPIWCTLAITISQPPTGSPYQWSFTIHNEESEPFRNFEAVQDVQGGQWRLNVHYNNPMDDPNYVTAVFIRRIHASYLLFLSQICSELSLPNVLAANRPYTSEAYVNDILNSLLHNGIIDKPVWDDVEDRLSAFSRLLE